VREAFDLSCWYWERLFSERMKGPEAARLAALYKSVDSAAQDAIREFVFKASIHAHGDLALFFDQNNIGLIYSNSAGDSVDVREVSDGLVGDWVTDYGWIARLTKYKEGLKVPPTEPEPETVIDGQAIDPGIENADELEETTDEFLDRLFGKDEDQDQT